MSTLHLSSAVTETIQTVPLEDWFEELADESLDPLNILLAAEFAEDEEYEYNQPDIQEHQMVGNIQINEEDTAYIRGNEQDMKAVAALEGIDPYTGKQTTIINNTGATIMSTTTLNNKAFNVKAFLALANVIDDVQATTNVTRVATPEWLTIKNGLGCTQANAFYVTAGIVKATRGIIDALTYTQRQHEDAVEQLTIQELRAGRTTVNVHNFGPAMTKVGIDLAFTQAAMTDVYDADVNAADEDHGNYTKVSGFNPDGMEYDLALVEATQAVDKLEAVIANGERIIGDIVTWIDTHAVALNLEVETGHTVTLGPIGNEVRRTRRERLTWETLLVGIQLQREFIRNNPRK